MKKLLPVLFLLFAHMANGQSQKLESASSSAILNQYAWDEIEPAVNGFSRVLKGQYFTFINTNGKPVSRPIFNGARNYSQHLAAVSINEKWGFLNETGVLQIPCVYDLAYDFKVMVTVAMKNKNWYLIGNRGQVIKQLDIDLCYGFTNNTAKVIKGGRVGEMNVNGNITWNRAQTEVVSRVAEMPSTPNVTTAVCPDNLDFEFGNFTNWQCYTGRVDSVGNTNVITVNPSAPLANRHRIVTRTNPSAVDFFGLFPTNPPDGSNACVKLGNTNIGAQAERIMYTIHVPANDSNFSVKYDYAVVFQDPGHTAWSQPRFTARIFDSATNAYVNCASFEYISTSNLPGFARSTVDTSVIYKSWSSVFISLSQYAGRTMYLEFTTADCVRRGHWGYAYVDVEPSCGRSISATYNCNFPNVTVLNGPPGFQTYNWWNGNFTTLLGSGQNTVLNPGPSTSANLWLEMIPYNSFGCRDTLSVALTTNYTPSFDVSETNASCAPHTITFINNDAPAQQVNWNFGDGTTGTGDTVSHTYTNPGTYIITMTSALQGGCSGTVRDTITITAPSASLSYNSGNYCRNTNIQLNVTATGALGYSWNFGDGSTQNTTTGNINHSYTTTGNFVPTVTVDFGGGCTILLTGTAPVVIDRVVPEFSTSIQQVCGSTTAVFQNLSTSLSGVSSYRWSFGDGSTATGLNANHTYANSGTYQVKLIVTSVSGCVDSISHNINIIVWRNPIAGIMSVQPICQNDQITLQAIVSSSDSIMSQNWVVSNGMTASGINASFVFTSADTFSASFVATTIHGCSDTAYRNIVVKPLPVIAVPADQQLCNGSSTSLVAFSSSLNGTVFNWVNDNVAVGLAASGTGNVPSFTAVNDTNYTVYANLTVNAIAQGCSANPVNFTYAIYPTPVSVQPADQTVCNRAATAPVIISSFTSAVASNTYTWTNNLPSIGLAANGSGNIPSFVVSNNTAQTQVATITLTARDNGCDGVPVQFTITVNPTPQMQTPPSDSVCNGAMIQAMNFTGITSGNQYTWTNNETSIGLPSNGNGPIAAFTGVNNSNNSITATLSVYPSLNGCIGDMNYFNIVVHPTPSVTRPADQRVCTGAPISAINFSGSVNGANYHWTNSAPSIGLGNSGTGNIPSFNPANNGLTAISATISVTPEFNGCAGAPQEFVLAVMPMADLIQPFNQILCNGQQTPMIAFTGTLNNTTFNWVNNNPSIGLGTAGTGNIPSFTVYNNTNVAQEATITVSASANGCPGNNRSFVIHIDPTPEMAQPASNTVCSGARIDSLVFVGSVAGTNFSWINSETQIGLPANGQGNMPAFIAVNNNFYPITAIISVVGLANSCNSLSRTFTITVNPSAAVDTVPDHAVCNGIQIASIPLTSPVAGTQLRWTNNHPEIGLPASGNGDIPSFEATNSTNTLILATIEVYGESADQCSTAVRTFKIAVNPSPSVNAGNDQTVCRGSLVNLNVAGASSYNWFPSTGLSCVGCANPQLQATDDVTYVVEGVNGAGCRAVDSVQLHVIQPFDMLVSPNDTLCAGKQVQLFANNADSYQWYPAAGLNNASIANPVATPVASTMYTVVGQDAAHCFTDTARVYITVAGTPDVQAGSDIQGATGTQVVLNPSISNGPVTNISWSPANGLSCDDCLHPVLTVTQNTSYVISVENRYGCKATDTLNVLAFCKNAQVFIPNAFTPDGDGINDVMMVRGTGVTVKSFRIFNRWGNLVFEKQTFPPNDIKYGWDGKVKGVPAAPDVYVYIAEVVCDNGTPYMYKGNVTIIK